MEQLLGLNDLAKTQAAKYSKKRLLFHDLVLLEGKVFPALSGRAASGELNQLEKVVEENADLIRRKWNEYFGS